MGTAEDSSEALPCAPWMLKVTTVKDRKMTGDRNRWRWWGWNLSRCGTAMRKHDYEGDCGR